MTSSLGSDPGNDRGSLVPLLAIVLAACALVLALLMLSTGFAVRSARAQWAADATALAIAAVGPDEAGIEAGRRLAEANGAELLGVSTVPVPGADPAPSLWPVVVVKVQVGRLQAEAAARRVPIDGG